MVEQSTFMFFFFSSRRRHTRLQGDWSSDVCSSDLSGSSMKSKNKLWLGSTLGNSRWTSFCCLTSAVACGTRSDRKSTRLNSSHLVISYAVFCLKKKKTYTDSSRRVNH